MNIWLQIALTMVCGGVLLSGIATVLTLRRHPEMQHATPQRRPLERSTRRRYAVTTLISAGLAVLVLVAAVLTQASVASTAVPVIGLVPLYCLVQFDRPLIRDSGDPVDPHSP